VPLAKITLTGTITDGEGNPLSGVVQFVPSVPLADPADLQVVRQAQINVTVGANGTFSAALYATDNANLEPPGWAWTVTEFLAGVPQSRYTSWSFYLPSAATTFTATNASPCVFTAASGTAYANGTGVTLSGASLPAGFTAGTVYFTVNASGATFQLAAAPGGSALGSASAGSGPVQIAQTDISAAELVSTGTYSPAYPFLPISGGALTGPLTLSGAPTTPLMAADKAYVDSSAGVQVAGDIGGTPAAPQVISTHLASPLPLAQGGTGTTSGTGVHGIEDEGASS
jgi:hypothetical protein